MTFRLALHRHVRSATCLALFTPVTAFAQAGMARLPGGVYVPLYATAPGEVRRVEGFRLDRRAVTRREYLAFVVARPEWQRGRMRPVHGDEGYLADWRGPLDAGTGAELEQPVTSVSWFAARAYCASLGKRLPDVDEWEYAAAASETKPDATRDRAFIQRLLELYSAMGSVSRVDRTAGFRNVYGLDGLHGVVWEWTEDFNSVMVSGDSREAGGTTRSTDFRAVCAAGAIGASDPGNYPAFMRFAFRAALNARSNARALGFRCAAGA